MTNLTSGLKVGDTVVMVKNGRAESTVLKVEGDRIYAQRHFNGSCYWDDKDYWRISE